MFLVRLLSTTWNFSVLRTGGSCPEYKYVTRLITYPTQPKNSLTVLFVVTNVDPIPSIFPSLVTSGLCRDSRLGSSFLRCRFPRSVDPIFSVTRMGFRYTRPSTPRPTSDHPGRVGPFPSRLPSHYPGRSDLSSCSL